MNLLSTTSNLNDLDKLAKEILQKVGDTNPFVIWMKAPMGGGKTTFAGFLLRAMGLDPRIPVQSPTFTYLNEYEINGEWYAHMDLYRMEDGSYFEDMILSDARSYRGMFIEWPEQVPLPDEYKANYVLLISPLDDPGLRKYEFQQIAQ